MFRNLTLAQQMFFFVLAVFLILLVFRILVKLEEQRIMREIVEQSRAAEAMGYRNDQISFEVKEGTPQIKIRQ